MLHAVERLLQRASDERKLDGCFVVDTMEALIQTRSRAGLTPKRFSRVVRLQRARAMAATTSDPDWAQIALACGYFDQSHMNLDFHALSGLSPTG